LSVSLQRYESPESRRSGEILTSVREAIDTSVREAIDETFHPLVVNESLSSDERIVADSIVG